MLRKNWTLMDVPVSDGKTVIITGANSGIGFELAKEMGARGYQVIMACRNVSNGNDAKDRIHQLYPQAKISVEQVDLADFSSIRHFSQRISANYSQIEILVNNAGIMDVPYRKTVDGNEVVFQTNYLGPYMLTALLFPLLEAAEFSRVVTVSSHIAARGMIDINHLQSGESDYDMAKTYTNSKLANLMFAVELHRQLQRKGSHVMSIAAHPGYARTNILNHSPSFWRDICYRIGNAVLAQDPAKGIIPIAYACVGMDAVSGEYYGPNGTFSEMSGDHPALAVVNAQVHDESLCAELWTATAAMTNTIFPFDEMQRELSAAAAAFTA